MSTDLFNERLLYAMNQRKMKQLDLVTKTGLSKARICQYVNGVYQPKPAAMMLLSEALGVNLQWLMGYDVPMQSEPPTKQTLDNWNTTYNPDNKLQLQVQAMELMSTAYGEDVVIFVGELLSLNMTSSEQTHILDFAKYVITKRGDE
jgi:transcriptional regulator with XRE-family HTH domain